MKNQHVPYRNVKLNIERLSSYIFFITELIYDDLLSSRNLNIKYIKICIIFFDKEGKVSSNYFYSKDRIKKMSQNSYNEYLSKKLLNFFKDKVKLENLKEFEASIIYII